ncbi:DUF885 family protein [Actinomarinicola tropica]|uniref:DUF885 family protein n=2 Tax=Actinomarinicola tropica TaxID=2789776 RepID=A0A5Q2RNQ6_9ACTN|nr:DUF885 family protein [Actinomarinicola tropica]
MATQPTSATILGDHRFDDRIEDHSEAGEQAVRDGLDGLRRRLAGIDGSVLTAEDVVTASLLRTELDDRIRQIDLRLSELSSDQMDGPHLLYLMSAPQLAAESVEQARALTARFAQMGTALGAVADRWRAGVASGRTPARLCVARSLSSVDGYLGSSLDDDLFANISGPDDDGWRDELREVVRRHVRPAYEQLRAVLADELLPVARPDDRAGLCWLDDGEEIYAELVRMHTSIAITPDELHAIGVERVEHLLPDEYRAIGQSALGTDDVAEIHRRIREDRDLRFRSEDEIVELAEATVARAAAVMGAWFGRVPRAACRVEPVPPILAEDAPGAYYFPPTEDGSRPGTYFINRRNATDQSRVEAESVAFHEAIPGHHLQLAIASELEGLPAFRRHGGSTAYLEGWGLYAERLADEMGLYSDDVTRLGMLAGDSWRSGRLVVDTGLHALGWSRQRARDYLWDNAPVGVDELEAEIDRYVAIPGQAVAYTTGQREIVRLRRDAEQRLGDRFDLPAFHDVVLGSGGITLPVLADLVDRWVADRLSA